VQRHRTDPLGESPNATTVSRRTEQTPAADQRPRAQAPVAQEPLEKHGVTRGRRTSLW